MAAVSPKTFNFRKLLPSLLLGVFITVLAALFNYLIYDRRLPARAAGHRVATTESGKSSPGHSGTGRGPSFMRALAGLVNISDDFAQDIMFTIRGPGDFPSTRDEIALVAIDEDSLVRHGSWPWRSSDVAELVAKVADARVVALDVLFPEPDRTSLANFIDQFDSLYGEKLDMEQLVSTTNICLDNDQLLADQISKTNTVLGAVLFNGMPPRHRPANMKNNRVPEAVLPGGKSVPQEDVLLKGAKFALTDIDCIRDVTPPPVGEGFMNLFPTPNGAVRSIPLFAHVADNAFTEPSGNPRRIVPSIAAEMLRVAKGGDRYRIKLRGDVVHIPEFADDASDGNRYTVSSLGILKDGEEIFAFPLNELAEIEVGFRNHRDDFTVYPAWEVMQGVHDGAFKDKLVIIGGTVEGVGSVVSASLPNPELSMPVAHAAMLSAMLKGDVLDGGYQYDFSWQQVAILASGLAVTVAIIFGDLIGGMLVSAMALVCWVLANYFLFFRRGMDVGVTLPIVSTLTVLLVLTVANYLVVGRERRFIRKAFQLNVSPSILGYLESHPDRLSSLQGDYRHMTVLFTDIRGFTSMSEKFSAPDLARFLNEYFTPMSDMVMAHMGTVDKFIGDGLMAFWNAPADNPHHARDAARSALGMLDKLKDLQHGWTSRGLPQIAIGCGINTGPMFAGYMGSEQRKNYTVMGDNVNIASRLENLNKTYSSSILISESTREELGKQFICRVVDKVRVSGKAAAVVIYELLGEGIATEEKTEELAAFSRVFQLYQEREFATAESLLKELVFIRPAPLYKMYLDRLAIYKALPPPPDWDGTFSMTHK